MSKIQNSIYSEEYFKAQDLINKGKYQNALDILNKILSKSFEYEEIWEDIAECHLWLDEDSKIEAPLNNALRINMTKNGWYLKGLFSHFIGQYERACHCFNQCIKISRINEPEALRRLGFSHSCAGRLEIGLALVLRSYELNKLNIETLLDLSAIYCDLNELNQAKKYWFMASKINPNHSDLKLIAKEINVNDKIKKST